MARGVSLVMAGALGVAGMVALGTGVASAAVPSFPNNVVVFPDRDFVTIEGYQDKVGQTATVEVKRAGAVIGSAQSVVGSGDVAFEINHPGGVCWGAGTGLNVTPDIRPSDEVSIKFATGEPDTTTTQDAFVDSDATLVGRTLTVKGHIGAGVSQARFEQRIINPDLVDTDVARRDVRALPGPVVVSDKGGYRSGVAFSGDTFTATYIFDTLATAQIAVASGGERAMTWQAEDNDGNRQGLTIAEHGEGGGPGMGGCPAGPADVAAPAGTYAAARSTDKAKLSVTWTPATAAPGTAAVTGYSVEAIAPLQGGVSKTVGARTTATGDSVTLDVDAALAYDVEVRSLTGTDGKMSVAFPKASTTDTPTTPGDTVIPPLTSTPAFGATGVAVEADRVTLGTEAGADIYYAFNEAAFASGLPTDAAKLYTGPIAITAETTLHAVALDAAGNFKEQVGTFKPTGATAVLAAPGSVTATAGMESVKVDWSAVAGATSYQVNVTGGAVTAPTASNLLTRTVTGLTAGTTYSFTVTAKDATRTSTPSVAVTATPVPLTVKVTVSSGRWKAGDLRIAGSSDAAPNANRTVTFYRANAAGAASNTQVGSPVALTAAVAPATGSTFDARFRNAAAGTTNPGRIVAVVKGGANGTRVQGTSPVFTVANG
ncbi:MAG TPA: FN3 associated domain-containing protein [Propionibacteriaceae bacterium]